MPNLLESKRKCVIDDVKCVVHERVAQDYALQIKVEAKIFRSNEMRKIEARLRVAKDVGNFCHSLAPFGWFAAGFGMRDCLPEARIATTSPESPEPKAEGPQRQPQCLLSSCLVLFALSLGGGFGSLCVQRFLDRYRNAANANRILPWHAFVTGGAIACVLAARADNGLLKDAGTQPPGSIHFMQLFLEGADLGARSLFLLYQTL